MRRQQGRCCWVSEGSEDEWPGRGSRGGMGEGGVAG